LTKIKEWVIRQAMMPQIWAKEREKAESAYLSQPVEAAFGIID
jgi:hypothetical protein